jgi:amino acid transporter
VSGGPYGIEDAVSSFGPGLALTLLILTPLIWSLPVALVMSEMASAMPDEGGYVTWVTRAFGRYWGFQVGWWSWINSFVDVAVYPTLFVEYARFWRSEMGPGERWLWALVFIVVLTGLNLVGVRPVGRAAVVLGMLALTPVALLVVVGVTSMSVAPWRPFMTEEQSLVGGLGLGLAVMMWNYSGWDTPSTTLGETRAPERAFRMAVFVALPIIAGAYLLPVTVGLASGTIAWTAWDTGALPRIAEKVGGPWLGHALAAGAVVSTSGLFLSLLLTNSRLPYVLARDGHLGAWLGSVHPRFGTPWAAVLVSALFYAGFAAFSFKELIVLNIWLYSLTLIVELAAFVRLRVGQPDMPRPWRVPGGTTGILATTFLPSGLCVLAMATAGWKNTLVGVVTALTGPLVYAVSTRRRR